MAPFVGVVYTNQDRQVIRCGVEMTDGDDFSKFMTERVAPRLYDEEGQTEFEVYLSSLGSTDFARKNLGAFLVADTEESKNWWDVGEAIAEAFLTQEHNVVWPWNMNRDKRNPRASPSGADLVGFKIEGSKVQFAFGEVKTSGDSNSPPRVMKGMTNQLKKLARDSSIIDEHIRWLFHRCKTESHKENFRSAMELFAGSKGKAVSFYGVLVRGVPPIETDLITGGKVLAEVISPPAMCHLLAIYIPCTVEELLYRVTEGRR